MGWEPFKWPDMCSIIPEGESGNAKVRHVEVSEQESSFTRLRAAIEGGDSYVPVGKYAQLIVDGGVMMSDTPMEKRSNMDLIVHARGDVLIGGLGLGMLTCALAKENKVESITVIEINPHVIELISPYVSRPNLSIVQGDIFTWAPPKGKKFDVLYFDIWTDICTDNLDDIAKLHRKYWRMKKPGGWMASWKQDELRYRRSVERRQGW